MDEQQWTGQLDLTVFFDGNRSVSRDIFFCSVSRGFEKFFE